VVDRSSSGSSTPDPTQAERGPAGGEDAQVLAQRHQGMHPVGRRRAPRARSCPAPAGRGRAPGRPRSQRYGATGRLGGRRGCRLPRRRPRADATSVATSHVGGGARELDDVHDALLRWLLTACARRVLPRPPVPTIDVTRDVRSRPATRRCRGPRPSSGLGSYRTPQADHGRIGPQQLLVHAPQRGARGRCRAVRAAAAGNRRTWPGPRPAPRSPPRTAAIRSGPPRPGVPDDQLAERCSASAARRAANAPGPGPLQRPVGRNPVPHAARTAVTRPGVPASAPSHQRELRPRHARAPRGGPQPGPLLTLGRADADPAASI